MKRNTLLTSTVVAALVAAPLAPAFAQTMEPEAPVQTQEAPAQATPETDFSEDQLNSFVDAALEVQGVQQEFAAQIQQAPEPEQKQALVMEAQEEMAAAVDGTDGMDVDTYNEISTAAQADPELNQRLMAMVQTRQGTMTE